MKEITQPSFVKRDPNVVDHEYMRLLTTLKDRFRKSQIYAAVKVNTSLLEFYWEMGRDISRLHADAKYGSSFFDCLSLDLKAEFPNQTGFSTTNIKYIKRWYEFYNQEFKNRQQVADDLGMPIEFGRLPWWHHIVIFTKSKSVAEALFYIDECIANGWSRHELEVEIGRNLYQIKGQAITNFDDKLPIPFNNLAKEILKSPYDLGFIDRRVIDELDLENALASDVTRFLLELGEGFAYIGRQKELRMPNGQTFRPDMIFYHTRLKCYIVCELKVTEFKLEYAGKLNFYVSAVDELMKQDDDKPTIGLLICKSADRTIVEWSLRGMTAPLGVAEYKLKQYLDNRLDTYLPRSADIQSHIDLYGKNTSEYS